MYLMKLLLSSSSSLVPGGVGFVSRVLDLRGEPEGPEIEPGGWTRGLVEIFVRFENVDFKKF